MFQRVQQRNIMNLNDCFGIDFLVHFGNSISHTHMVVK